MPKKSSQKFNVERKMALHPTLSLYEIDPGSQREEKLIFAIKGLQGGSTVGYQKTFSKNYFLHHIM